VPAIAGGIGGLWAFSDGGTDKRTRPFELAGVATAAAGVPGPGDLGLAWPG